MSDIVIYMNQICTREYLNRHLEPRLVPIGEAWQRQRERDQVMILIDQGIDFAISFAIRIDDERSVIVTYALLENEIHMTVNELWDFYIDSEPYGIVLAPLDKTVEGWLDGDEYAVQNHLLEKSDAMICTNEYYHQGAACFFHPSTQRKLWEFFPGGFYVLFSSRHETIIVNKNLMSAEAVNMTFQDANTNADVTPVEDRVTHYIYQMTKPFRLERMVIENDAQ